eukprot:CAMPEP_0113252014 /NCGR_PEP_ID=MMETSP0008_2-20120614/12427_1 /TAXON_ID=97485 /ORGANISM="Prymnesium parvum" /LENGTH=639 /DNA_ID=CAMNT_0000100107 /DNA_START=62 /DNA_END=1981 /DNA_ORIENTATION=- /assembly_acc=CAM_ASM_000153
MTKDRRSAIEFAVIFSQPTPARPVPEHTATVAVTVFPPLEDDDRREFRITYSLEAQHSTIESSTPFGEDWIDSIIRRKQMILHATNMFAAEGKLPQPRAFYPYEHIGKEGVQQAQLEGELDALDRVEDAADKLANALELERLNRDETAAELEGLLVNIFTQADLDENGVLDEKEFKALLDTADLNLTDAEKKQLMAMADVNTDGMISYAEFAPLGADIIQTMRMRRLHMEALAYRGEVAEVQARESLHGLQEEEMTEFLVEAFRRFDVDQSGYLDLKEMKECLLQLDLRPRHGKEPVRLSQREVAIVMAYMDDDASGVIEYNEFAPRMFNWMVEAMKLGFMQTHVTELEAYLQQHVASYDSESTGVLSRSTMKQALKEADLLKPPLTQIQVLTLLADADFDEDDNLDYAPFISDAAPLVQGMCDPALNYRRAEVGKRATISTPIAALTEEEQRHFMVMVKRIFHGFDANESGRLEFSEFRSCLKESNIGLSDKQISYLMSVADVDEDNTIDYEEFVTLFFDALVELARSEAIERELKAEKASEAVNRMLDMSQLTVPLNILFDMTAGSSPEADATALADALEAKASDWGIAEGIMPITAELRTMDTVSWPQLSRLLVKLSEELATETDQAEAEAPTGVD